MYRSSTPQPLLVEGLAAERLYRKQVSNLNTEIARAWNNEIVNNEDSKSEDDECEDDSDVDSIMSIVPDNNDDENWTCTDSDSYVPSIDTLSDCNDKVYDPCFWLPALHHFLMQQEQSVRQLANTGALSLIIAGVGSNCPLLRGISISRYFHFHNMCIG
jgi:hypothetical protein